MPEEITPSTSTSFLPDEWGVDDTTDGKRRRKAIGLAAASKHVRHGLLASIPMICRDSECPYKAFCPAQQAGLVVRGERCVKEIGELMESSERYYEEFKIDPSDPGVRVDAAQVQQLLSLEVLIRRCEMLLAQGDLIEMVEAAIDPRSGDSVMQPQLHKAADFLPKLQRRHSEILRDLNATRKDKLAASSAFGISIAEYNKEIMAGRMMAEHRLGLIRAGKHDEADDYGVIEADLLEVKESDLPKLPEN